MESSVNNFNNDTVYHVQSERAKQILVGIKRQQNEQTLKRELGKTRLRNSLGNTIDDITLPYEEEATGIIDKAVANSGVVIPIYRGTENENFEVLKQYITVHKPKLVERYPELRQYFMSHPEFKFEIDLFYSYKHMIESIEPHMMKLKNMVKARLDHLELRGKEREKMRNTYWFNLSVGYFCSRSHETGEEFDFIRNLSRIISQESLSGLSNRLNTLTFSNANKRTGTYSDEDVDPKHRKHYLGG